MIHDLVRKVLAEKYDELDDVLCGLIASGFRGYLDIERPGFRKITTSTSAQEHFAMDWQWATAPFGSRPTFPDCDRYIIDDAAIRRLGGAGL